MTIENNVQDKQQTSEPAQEQEQAVLFHVDEQHVAHVILNNPQKHNAFDDQIISQLCDLFEQINQTNTIRAMVLSSTGKSFSAGANLAWMKRMASYSFEDNLKDANGLALMLNLLNNLNVPTIAKVQGAAFGGAVGLVSCCDIAIASEKASFCLSEVKLGLIPATISPYVINAMGERACRRYFLTAERFSSETAARLGLVNEVCSNDELDNTVNKILKGLLKNGPQAVSQAKSLIQDVCYKQNDEELREDTSHRIAQIRVSKEGQEGLTAFFENRMPNWQKSVNKES